jgi:hypothetical protein
LEVLGTYSVAKVALIGASAPLAVVCGATEIQRLAGSATCGINTEVEILVAIKYGRLVRIPHPGGDVRTTRAFDLPAGRT